MNAPHSSHRTANDSVIGDADSRGGLRTLLVPVVVVDKPDPLRQVGASCKRLVLRVKKDKSDVSVSLAR